MTKFVTVIGTRPQFVKAAAISRAFFKLYPDQATEIIIHTGQHYDPNMSQVFFDEMKIPKPDYNLSVGSKSHGEQTAEMISGIEKILLKEQPQGVILYGDTNSTLAGAIAASKLHFPVIHVEAGLRSFNKNMPEEINRILCDHVSTLLFSPTSTGVENLIREGFSRDNQPLYTSNNPKIWHCGDVMYDNTLFFSEYARNKVNLLEKLGIQDRNFILVTVHRPSNTDKPEYLTAIFKALLRLAFDHRQEILFPMHPRTSKLMEQNVAPEVREALKSEPGIYIIPPVSFLEITHLEDACQMVITDSGGVQKEAFFLKKPCIVLRKETEWVELVENGTCLLSGPDEMQIIAAWEKLSTDGDHSYPEIFGTGNAAEFIVRKMVEELG